MLKTYFGKCKYFNFTEFEYLKYKKIPRCHTLEPGAFCSNTVLSKCSCYEIKLIIGFILKMS